jgi:hypothetical protein
MGKVWLLAIACIQMWGAYDHRYVAQSEIAASVGAFTTPYDIAMGVSEFTDSTGWLEWTDANSAYNQDLCVAYSIACVKDKVPSIMPFYGDHAVLSIGYQSHADEIGTPIADNMTYHDPDPIQGGNLNIIGPLLKERFQPTNGLYWVVVGYRWHVYDGRDGYNAFLEAGGTYYGGPLNYHPETF